MLGLVFSSLLGLPIAFSLVSLLFGLLPALSFFSICFVLGSLISSGLLPNGLLPRLLLSGGLLLSRLFFFGLLSQSCLLTSFLISSGFFGDFLLLSLDPLDFSFHLSFIFRSLGLSELFLSLLLLLSFFSLTPLSFDLIFQLFLLLLGGLLASFICLGDLPGLLLPLSLESVEFSLLLFFFSDPLRFFSSFFFCSLAGNFLLGLFDLELLSFEF
mmetsp:Transcript_5045/g.7591  ORF Transcript_5045/g.7591 Transcript_5045/m.7591 type:complete len:214 (-) Transcript_5045:1142-1783(-)